MSNIGKSLVDHFWWQEPWQLGKYGSSCNIVTSLFLAVVFMSFVFVMEAMRLKQVAQRAGHHPCFPSKLAIYSAQIASNAFFGLAGAVAFYQGYPLLATLLFAVTVVSTMHHIYYRNRQWASADVWLARGAGLAVLLFLLRKISLTGWSVSVTVIVFLYLIGLVLYIFSERWHQCNIHHPARKEDDLLRSDSARYEAHSYWHTLIAFASILVFLY